MPEPSPIDRLRRAEAILRESGDPVGLAVADGLRMHVHEGVALPRALGLVRYGGGGGYAVIERRADRDAMLRELHRRYFPDLGPRPAASAIMVALDRQKRSRTSVADDLCHRLLTLLHFDPPVPCSVRQVRRILATNTLF